MDYFANVDGVVHFAREVFPAPARRASRRSSCWWSAARPSPAVRALGDLPGVQVTGAVGDVRPFLARAWVFVAPLRIAQGVQNKVLEAMAWSCRWPAPSGCSPASPMAASGPARTWCRPTSRRRSATASPACSATPGCARAIAERARRELAAAFTWEHNLEILERVLTDAVDADRLMRPAPPAPVTSPPSVTAKGARSA